MLEGLRCHGPLRLWSISIELPTGTKWAPRRWAGNRRHRAGLGHAERGAEGACRLHRVDNHKHNADGRRGGHD